MLFSDRSMACRVPSKVASQLGLVSFLVSLKINVAGKFSRRGIAPRRPQALARTLTSGVAASASMKSVTVPRSSHPDT